MNAAQWRDLGERGYPAGSVVAHRGKHFRALLGTSFEPGTKGASWRECDPPAQPIHAAPETWTAMNEQLVALKDEISTLRTKHADEITALRGEIATGLADAFKGSHQQTLAYGKGSLTVHDGSLWLAIRDAEAGVRPGKSPSWVMVTRHGRDSKDSR